MMEIRLAWIFHTRQEAIVKYPPRECRTSGRGTPAADTLCVSGLPRQLGGFRRIVGPAGAYFTRVCEICGLEKGMETTHNAFSIAVFVVMLLVTR